MTFLAGKLIILHGSVFLYAWWLVILFFKVWQMKQTIFFGRFTIGFVGVFNYQIGWDWWDNFFLWDWSGNFLLDWSEMLRKRERKVRVERWEFLLHWKNYSFSFSILYNLDSCVGMGQGAGDKTEWNIKYMELDSSKQRCHSFIGWKVMQISRWSYGLGCDLIGLESGCKCNNSNTYILSQAQVS